MEQVINQLLTGYLVLMTLTGFVVMGIDKRKAVKRAWRIPERTLFVIAFIGGGLGALAGMYVFRHKTKHMRFVLLFPIAALIYVVLGLKLWGLI